MKRDIIYLLLLVAFLPTLMLGTDSNSFAEAISPLTEHFRPNSSTESSEQGNIWMYDYAPAFAPPSGPLEKTFSLKRYQQFPPVEETLKISWWYDAQQRPPEYFEKWEYSDGSYEIYHSLVTFNEGFLNTGYSRFDSTGQLISETSYDPFYVYFPYGYKKVSDSWAAGSVSAFDDGTGVVSMSVTTDHYTIVGLEDVVVPAGTFRNCLKLSRIRNTQIKVYWLARKLGIIKAYYSFGQSFELTGYAPSTE